MFSKNGDDMQEITLKQNNIVVLSCSLSQDIGGNPVSAAVLQSSGEIVAMQVNIIDARNFNVIIDTSLLNVGKNTFDIRVGNVSSESIIINVLRSIS